MKNKLKRILSMVMVVTMLLGLMPTEVFAIGTGETGPVAWSMDTYSASTISDGGNTTITVGNRASLTGNSGNNHSWSSSNSSVATVSGNDRTATVTGVAVGTATITHTYRSRGNKTETFTVTVTAPIEPTNIRIPETEEIEKYSSIQLEAELEPEGASGTVEWISGDPGIATVDQDGTVKGVSEGKVPITAKIQGTEYSATCIVTVTAVTSYNETAHFFYLKTPTSNPSSNRTDQWGSDLGEGKINVEGATFVGINCNVVSETDRVVNWPSGYPNGAVQKGSEIWDIILDAYESELKAANASANDVESITLSPFKISNNSDGYHVDCTVDITLKDNRPPYTVKWFLYDAGDAVYVQKAAETVYGYNTQIEVNSAVDNLPETKTVGERVYRLLGWYDNGNLSGDRISFPYTVSGSINFYAKYVSDFILTYNLDGGSWNTTYKENYPEGDTVHVKTTVPTKTGYTFNGWKSSVDNSVLEGGYTFTMPEQDVTLTAQWKKNSYTVTYTDGVEGEEIFADKTATVTYGTVTPAFVGTPTRTGYTFAGWDPEVAATVTGNATYKAQWTLNSYTVTYTLDGEQVGEVETYNYNAPVTIREKATKTGYTVSDWSITEGFNMPAENLTITATSTINSYTVTYTLDGEQVGEVETYEYGLLVTIREKATKTGYTVSDWSRTKNFSMPAENVTITATSTVNSYDLTIHYVYEDGTEAAEDYTATLDYNATYEVKSPTITGYTADKTTVAGTMGTADVEVTVKYSINSHKVIYKITGEYFANAEYNKTENVAYGTELSLITDDMSQNGYTFEGWTGLPETMPDEDVEVTGYYSIRTDLSYTVNYLEQGTNAVLAGVKTVNGQTYKASVTEKAVDITGYDKVAPTSVTFNVGVGHIADGTDAEHAEESVENNNEAIEPEVPAENDEAIEPDESTETEAPAEPQFVENNIINFYYTKRTDLRYTVNYLEQGTNRVLAKAKTVDGQTYQASVTEEAIDIAGYNKVAPTSETITIGVGENVINFYYTKRTDLGYTVNYYKDSETAANLIGTDMGSGTFDAEIPYEDGKYLPTGYLKPGTISGQMIITAIEENNVMNVVYTKRAFTVEPLESIMYSGVDTRGLRQPVVKDAADPNKVLRLNIDYELAYETDWADYTNVRLDADGKLTSVPVIVRGKGDIYGKNAVSTYARTADSDDNSEVRVWYAITPREVTLTSASAAKVYDGTPLVSHNVTVGGNGFVGAQGVTYTFYGSQTEIGESYNTYDFELIEGTLERNYNITKRDGILTVTDRQTFNLTVNYIDEGGAPIAPAYVGAFAAGAPYFVQSPYIEGYTPNFDTVESGTAGMPKADVTLTVVYTINPENDPHRGEIVEDGDGYTLVEITDENVPLAGGLHKDCILHFLLMCAAFIVQLFYTKKRKKYQQRIFELRKKLGDTDMDDEDEKK